MTSVRLLIAVLATLAVLVLAGPAAADEKCVDTGRVCLSVTSDLPSVSINGYASFTARVRNVGPSTINHVVLTDGPSVVDARPAGSCVRGAGTATCDLGQLGAGAEARVQISVRTPGAPGSLVNTASVSFDEGGSDTDSGKQDTITGVSSSVPVTATPGSATTWLPPDTTGNLTTDPLNQGLTTAQQQIGQATIPAQSTGLVAKLRRAADPGFACPKKAICREGAWMLAEIPGFVYAGAPLGFHLTWAGDLVSRRQTTSNFELIYRTCNDGNCPNEFIRTFCSSRSPSRGELPCLWGLSIAADRTTRVTVFRSENGRMR